MYGSDLTDRRKNDIIYGHAAMVKLVDTKDLKSFGRDSVPVRARLAAPDKNNPSQVFLCEGGLGLFIYGKIGILVKPVLFFCDAEAE